VRHLQLLLQASILGLPAVALAQTKADEEAVRALPKDFCAAWAIAIPGTVPGK
jgi:hypothetical protein